MKYAIGFIIACVLWVWVLSMVDMPSYKVYDCGMAEWHPDIPNEVKEECRKRRQHEWKQNYERTT